MHSTAFQRPVSPAHRTVAEIEKALDPIDGLTTAGDLESYLGGLVRDLGFDFFSYGMLDRSQIGARVHAVDLFLTSYPRPWRARTADCRTSSTSSRPRRTRWSRAWILPVSPSSC